MPCQTCDAFPVPVSCWCWCLAGLGWGWHSKMWGDTVQEPDTPPPRPARPRPRDVMSAPSQSAPSVPPAASQSQAEVFPRSSLPLAGGGRGAGGAGNTAGRAAPGPRRPQSASCLRPRRTEHARGAARDRSAAAAAAGGRAQPPHRGHRGRPHPRHQVCRV